MAKRTRLIVTLLAVVLLVGAYVARKQPGRWSGEGAGSGVARRGQVDSASDEILAEAYRSHRSGFVVEGSGVIRKILGDDVRGSRHQRFILRLGTGQTLLVSHNIDVAPRVQNAAVGDRVDFRGQYEWNDRGGLIHWTHRDPGHRRPGGWLRHGGRLYR